MVSVNVFLYTQEYISVYTGIHVHRLTEVACPSIHPSIHLLSPLLLRPSARRHPRPGDPRVQGGPAELLHHHQQGHHGQGRGVPHGQRVRPAGLARLLLPVRGVGQPRGRHQAAAAARPALQAGRPHPAQRQVRRLSRSALKGHSAWKTITACPPCRRS